MLTKLIRSATTLASPVHSMSMGADAGRTVQYELGNILDGAVKVADIDDPKENR